MPCLCRGDRQAVPINSGFTGSPCFFWRTKHAGEKRSGMGRLAATRKSHRDDGCVFGSVGLSCGGFVPREKSPYHGRKQQLELCQVEKGNPCEIVSDDMCPQISSAKATLSKLFRVAFVCEEALFPEKEAVPCKGSARSSLCRYVGYEHSAASRGLIPARSGRAIPYIPECRWLRPSDRR